MESRGAFEFIFTAPTFVPDEVTDADRKVRREFYIPKAERERGFYGSEFEIQLKNKLTQKAIAKECAEWMRRKATFRSNRSKAPMQQFICLHGESGQAVYQPLHGFTAVDLGYQPGNAVSNFVSRMDEPSFAATYLSLFDQAWNDPEKIQDVTRRLRSLFAAEVQQYKRPSEADSSKCVVGDYFSTDWLPADTARSPLPVALNLAGLYEQMLRRLMPIAARPGESVQALAERYRCLASKQRELAELDAQGSAGETATTVSLTRLIHRPAPRSGYPGRQGARGDIGR